MGMYVCVCACVCVQTHIWAVSLVRLGRASSIMLTCACTALYLHTYQSRSALGRYLSRNTHIYSVHL